MIFYQIKRPSPRYKSINVTGKTDCNERDRKLDDTSITIDSTRLTRVRKAIPRDIDYDEYNCQSSRRS